MILKVYATRDRKLGAYGHPVYDDHEKNVFKEIQYRGILANATSLKADLIDTEMYYLGTYDDITATFDLLDKPEFFLDLSEPYRAGLVQGKEIKEQEKKDE